MIKKKTILSLYENMLTNRLTEEAIAQKYLEGKIRLAIHLYVGQEAVAAGVCENLEKGDYIFSNHRSHGHYIAGKGNLERLFAELYGKVDGCSSAKGGSMHLFDENIGYLGSTSIVGGNIPIAVGAAFRSKYLNLRNVTVCFFGDGAVDEGAFYESINFACLKKLPILFVCENNLYAIFSHIKTRQKYDNIYKRYKEIGLPGRRINGNNVLEVYKNAKELINKIRRGSGPFLLECRTYRLKGHAGPHSDENLGYRSKQEIDYWRKRCPVETLKRYIINNKILKHSGIILIKKRIDKAVGRAVLFAEKSRLPKKNHLALHAMSEKKIKI